MRPRVVVTGMGKSGIIGRKISATPAIVPVRGVLTSNYGVRRDPITGIRANHLAIDIAAIAGRRSAAPFLGMCEENAPSSPSARRTSAG
mgnify:CR=1 FL=1